MTSIVQSIHQSAVETAALVHSFSTANAIAQMKSARKGGGAFQLQRDGPEGLWGLGVTLATTREDWPPSAIQSALGILPSQLGRNML
jgi:hypothetical protein